MDQNFSFRTAGQNDDSLTSNKPSNLTAAKKESIFITFLHERLLLILFPLVVLGIVGSLWGYSHLSDTLIQTMALQEAKRYSNALREFRSLYTSEVVARVKKQGVNITHDYAMQEGAIPLPATLSKLLGQRISELEQGQVRLYSQYPFPWRKNGGPQDEFEHEALARLKQDPTQPFYRFAPFEGRQTLRYATADLMQESCVECHNNHPDTPKSGWKTGDLRGVLEIIHPLDATSIHVNQELQILLILILVAGVFGITGLALVISKLRRDSKMLEHRIRERTHDLIEANMEMEKQVHNRKTAEEKFGALLETAPDPLIIVNQKGEIHLSTPQFSQTFGYSQNALLGQSVEMLVPDEFRGHHEHLRKDFMKNPKLRQMQRGREISLKGHDGQIFPVEITLGPVKIGEETLVVCFIKDITERKKAAMELKNAFHYTEELLTSISSILIGINAKGIVTRWNTTAESTFGLLASQAMGHSIREIGIKWDWAAMEEGMSQCETLGESVRLECVTYRKPSGEEGVLGINLAPLWSNQDKGFKGLLLLGLDISERMHLEAQLALAQKMEAIGQLAAGVAHEINTPTQFVGDNLRFLQDGFSALQTVLRVYADVLQTLPPGTVPAPLMEQVEATVAEADMAYIAEEIPKALKQALGGTERVATIVRAMKDFSHPGTGEKKPIDLNKAIENTIMVARNEWKYVAEVVTDLAPTLPLVSCLPGEFNQVILNLLVNAAHAIADVVGRAEGHKGTITISTQLEDNEVAIRVADTGKGMSEATRLKIFDPFFTTKEVGKGTGQGLAIVHDVVVVKHNGTIAVETKEGVGTTFLIRLPLDAPVERKTHHETANIIC